MVTTNPAASDDAELADEAAGVDVHVLHDARILRGERGGVFGGAGGEMRGQLGNGGGRHVGFLEPE